MQLTCTHTQADINGGMTRPLATGLRLYLTPDPARKDKCETLWKSRGRKVFVYFIAVGWRCTSVNDECDVKHVYDIQYYKV